jgi:FMN phosphatase YigB (HAD superfamily)
VTRGPGVVFFDLGGVVCRFHPERRLAALAAATGLAEPDIHARIWGSGLDDRMDRGDYTLEEAHRAVVNALGRPIARDTLVSAWALASEPDADVLVLVDAVRRDRRAAMLSDNGPLLLAALPRHLPELAPRFDPLCFSSDLGAVKPTVTCFARALARAGVDAADALLIDDVPANVEGARAHGLGAIHFTGARDLAQELARRGIEARR